MNPEKRRRPETPRAVLDARRLITNPDAAAVASESQRKLSWLVAASAMGRTPRQRRQVPDAIGGGVTFEDALDFHATEATIRDNLAADVSRVSFLKGLAIAAFSMGAITAPLLWLSSFPTTQVPAKCVIAPTSCQTFEDSLSQNARL